MTHAVSGCDSWNRNLQAKLTETRSLVTSQIAILKIDRNTRDAEVSASGHERPINATLDRARKGPFRAKISNKHKSLFIFCLISNAERDHDCQPKRNL